MILDQHVKLASTGMEDQNLPSFQVEQLLLQQHNHQDLIQSQLSRHHLRRLMQYGIESLSLWMGNLYIHHTIVMVFIPNPPPPMSCQNTMRITLIEKLSRFNARFVVTLLSLIPKDSTHQGIRLSNDVTADNIILFWLGLSNGTVVRIIFECFNLVYYL